jgi:CDP-diacylglycerol--glycerol-3-phosphate 3-phosphatidyltransferase
MIGPFYTCARGNHLADIVERKKTFTDKMRSLFQGVLAPIVALLSRLGIRPNMVTLFGLAGTIVCAVLVAMDHLTAAGLLLLLMGPVDALDGALARLRNEASDWGAFVDSVTDRYAELFIFGSLIVHFVLHQNSIGILFAYLAASGSVLVSYVKARADASRLDANVGLLTRFERYIILIPALIFNQPLIAMAIIGLFAHFTAFQRILRVRADAHRRQSQP